MDTAQVDGSTQQICKISSSQGIMIPLWIAECDYSGGDDPRRKSYSDEQLTMCKGTIQLRKYKIGCQGRWPTDS